MRTLMTLVVATLALALLAATGAPTITVREAWVRTTAPGAPTAAVYGLVENTSDAPDRLVAVESDAAEAAELHSMTMKDGMMEMRPVEGGLSVPGKGTLQFKPGGYHIMLVNPKAQLEAGDTIEVTLVFEKAGRVTLPIKAMAQAGGMSGHGAMQDARSGHGAMEQGKTGHGGMKH